MGIFSGVFGDKESRIKWIDLTSSAQLEVVLNSRDGRLKVIFKHSTRCGISSMAKGRLETNFNTEWQGVDMYYLDLLAYRQLSNELADKLNVVHQSPQLIVLRDGEVLDNASHEGVHVEVIANQL